MNSEEAMEKYLVDFESDAWQSNSEAYQRLLAECGGSLLSALLECVKHPLPAVRAAVAPFLAHQQPHTLEMIEAIAPLINDPDPVVRIKTIECVKAFGTLALNLVDQLYEIVQRERTAEDQVPRILAMGALLHIDREAWEEELMPQLTKAATSETGDLAEYVALRQLLELHGQQLPEEPDMPGEPRLES